MHLRVVVIVLASGLGACARSRPRTAGPEVVIYDPRQVSDPRGVTMLVGPKRLDAVASKRVLDGVFRGRYLTDSNQCKDTVGATLEAQRAAGDFAPSVFQVADGSFTERGKSQRLYLMNVGECGASHADNFGSMMLAVFQGDSLQASAIIDGGSSLEGVFDLDGDGRDEFLLAMGGTHQGTTAASATLVRFESGRLVDVRAFGEVLLDGCGSGDPEATSKFSLIYARERPGQAAEFRVESRTEPCPAR
jgi:hypothetical protein